MTETCVPYLASLEPLTGEAIALAEQRLQLAREIDWLFAQQNALSRTIFEKSEELARVKQQEYEITHKEKL